MTRQERTGIFYPSGPFKGRLTEISELSRHASHESQNDGMRNRKQREKQLPKEKASCYAQFLGRIEELELPYMDPYSRHVFNYYTIRLRNSLSRDKMQKYLSLQGIATAIYYPLSLHLQEVFKSSGYKPGDFPESERAQEEVLSLPMYPELSEGQIEEVAKTIKTQIQSN